MAPLASSPQAYRQGAVLAATPVELVVMLYDGARRFLRQGAAAMRAGEVERAHNALRRGELIIAHLDAALDLDQGQLPARLDAIYSFCLRHLNDARMSQDAEHVDEVVAMLDELRESWAHVAAEETR